MPKVSRGRQSDSARVNPTAVVDSRTPPVRGRGRGRGRPSTVVSPPSVPSEQGAPAPLLVDETQVSFPAGGNDHWTIFANRLIEVIQDGLGQRPTGSENHQSIPPTLPATTVTSTGIPGQFGQLPPPASIASLPVCTSLTLCSANQSGPLLSTAVTSSPPLPAPTTQTNQQPGLILSPAADPIPHSLVQRIQARQFVEMRDLLADNIALLNQLSSMGNTNPFPSHRTRLREVPSLVSWLYCFNAFIAVRTTDRLACDMLAYSRLIIHEALQHGNMGWLEYDRIFRRQIAINPQMSWNTLEPGLQASTILGQRSSGGTLKNGHILGRVCRVCTLCRECDHSLAQCALSPLQQQLFNYSRPPRRPETLQHICVAWNRGNCKRSNCLFKHICATCQATHKARDCPDTPSDSDYKTGITAVSR